jgi:tryptophan synthase alpha chain
MSSRRTGEIGRAFARARAEGRAALVPFLTAGFPDPEVCSSLLLGMADAGADVIELGVPFSEPVADGPIIQRASERALAGGMTLERALALAAAFRQRRATPLVLFSYLNPLLARGIEAAAGAATRAGLDGILVCDLPPDEAPEIRERFLSAGLDYVSLVAPTSAEARVQTLARASTGFVYLIARTGVTGEEGEDERLAGQVAALRGCTDLPVAVGFGIGDAQSARRAAALADGVVVGSAFLDRIAAAGADAGLALLREIRLALALEPAAAAGLTTSTTGP